MKSHLHNVGGWTARWAERAPARPAVTDEHRALDYRSFELRIARLSGWLRGQGVSPGDRVAMMLGNRTATLEGVFAAARIGAISLPINTRLSPREVAFLLDDCRPVALLFEWQASEVIEKACAAASSPPRARLAVGASQDAYEIALAASPPLHDVHPVSPDEPMMLMYTSGTTGAPKGALLPHRKTLFNSLNAQLFFGIRSEDRVLVVSPLFHSLGLNILSIPVVYAGGSLLLQSHFDPKAVLDAIDRERITYMGAVPTVYQRLFDELSLGSEPFDGSSLRFLFTAGSAIPTELVHAYQSRGLVLKQGYGQTETSILCCLESEDAQRKAGSVGRPVFHADVRVVRRADLPRDTESWRETEVGETGEIVVRGPINMLGYWQREKESSETIRGDWLRTGDLATRDDEGFLSLVGRARDMYISGGENVYPAEIEAVYADHPSIREIAVRGVPDTRWGEAGCAHVVLASGHALDTAALVAWGRERLARFKIPQRFQVESELPRTASGKVQKHLLADPPAD